MEQEVLKVNKKHSVESSLPLSRIKIIMKSSLNTGQIANDVLFLMAKSTEIFVQHLTRKAYKKVKESSTLKYNNLSQYVLEEKNLEFLLQIVPQKIKVKDFKEILDQECSNNSSSESEEENV